jgi:hypothetical protein
MDRDGRPIDDNEIESIWQIRNLVPLAAKAGILGKLHDADVHIEAQARGSLARDSGKKCVMIVGDDMSPSIDLDAAHGNNCRYTRTELDDGLRFFTEDVFGQNDQEVGRCRPTAQRRKIAQFKSQKSSKVCATFELLEGRAQNRREAFGLRFEVSGQPTVHFLKDVEDEDEYGEEKTKKRHYHLYTWLEAEAALRHYLHNDDDRGLMQMSCAISK